MQCIGKEHFALWWGSGLNHMHKEFQLGMTQQEKSVYKFQFGYTLEKS